MVLGIRLADEFLKEDHSKSENETEINESLSLTPGDENTVGSACLPVREFSHVFFH